MLALCTAIGLLGFAPDMVAQTALPAFQKFVEPSPSPTPPGETYAPPMSGVPVPGTPVAAEWTRTAGPDESIVLSGAALSSYAGADFGKDSKFLVYGSNTIKEARIQRVDSNKAMLTMDRSLPKSMYLLWPKNSKGYGYPLVINKTEAWWVGPSQATRGETVSVYGRNLSRYNGTSIAYIYLKLIGGAGKWIPVTAVNPYKVDFVIPANLPNGTYEVWAHNGHGGKYGWSSPLQLHVADGVKWTATVFNVKNYGAKGNGITDDTKAIRAALTAARNSPYSTVYFPAGNYLFSDMLELSDYTRWRGDGKASTYLKCMANFATAATAIVYANAVNAEIRDMSFDKYQLSMTNNIDRVFNMRGSNHVWFNNVGFSFAGFDVWNLHTSRYFFITNCSIIASRAFLGNCSQLFIDKCGFKLTYDAEVMLHSWNGKEISITNCTCSDLNNADPSNGAGWGKGRFFVGNGIWGSNTLTYLGQNTTKDLTVRLNGPDQNSGEQFLWEGNQTLWSGVVASATSTTATLSGFTGTLPDLSYAVIVKGKGFGQSRRIVRYANGTITLSEPWNLIPDKTSTINIGAYADKIVIYKNYLDAKLYAATSTAHIASAGIEPFGGVFNMIGDNNTFHELRTGIANWGLNSKLGIDPNYFNLFTNNTFINCRWAITNTPSVTTAKGIIAIFGTVFRNNSIRSPVIAGVFNDVDATDFPVLSTIVYEHNSFNYISRGVESKVKGVDNQMYYSNTFSSATVPAMYAALQVTPKSVLRQNTYQGFLTHYKDSLPGIFEAPSHVIELTGFAAGAVIDTSITLWNSGATPINWKAVSNVAWLTLSTTAGTIQNERGSSTLRFKANSKNLAAGVYTAFITVSTAAQRRVYTVLLKVVNQTSCSNTGSIYWQYWANLAPWKPISDIPVNSTPTGTGKLAVFSMPQNMADNFGGRIRGFVCPPESGNYVFYISSDDYSELWLGTSDNETSRQKIASVPGWANPNDYTKYTSQQSAPVLLQAGRGYYIEAIYRENNGADHLSVGWKTPGGQLERPIDGRHLIPYPAQKASLTSLQATGNNKLVQENACTFEVFPNPSNGNTSITYSLADDQYVLLQVYDTQGMLVQSLYQGNAKAQNRYNYVFDPQPYPNGTYICRLTYGKNVFEKKLVVMR